MNIVPKETFRDYSTDSKLDTVYDVMHNIYEILDCRKENCVAQEVVCNERMDKLEKGQTKWKLVSGVVASVSGMIGGAIAWVSSKFFIGS